MAKTVIAGAGVFGTALAQRLAQNAENDVTLHTIIPEIAKEINAEHTNLHYVPAKRLNERIRATTDDAIFEDTDVIFLAVPAEHILSFSKSIRPFVKNEPLVINLAKGMTSTGAFITHDIPFVRASSLKGPSFATEVINGLPSAFTFGGSRPDFAYLKDDVLAHTGFALDFCADIRAVELCSVLKNMYAIAIGIVSGRFDSRNVDFMVYANAIREMRELLKLYSCDPEAIFRYCGLGDLGLTALNDLSRNRTFGLLLGKGFAIDPDTNASTIIEGRRTIRIIYEEIEQLGVSEGYPLLSALYEFIYKKSSLSDFLKRVLP